MNEDIQRQLQPWKTKAFREGAICLEDVIASLKGGNSDLIELVPNKAQTVWTVGHTASSRSLKQRPLTQRVSGDE